MPRKMMGELETVAWAMLARDMRTFCRALKAADEHYGPPTTEPAVVGPSDVTTLM